jgi:Uma2 family endonuclease
MAAYEIKTRRWTRAEYDRLIELGFFQPNEPIELIGGQLMVAEPQGAAHYTAIQRTARALEAAFGSGWVVRTQGPIRLDDESEPEPDVAVVSGTAEDYRNEHPARPVLTVEIAESSLGSDRERKGSLYARAGLQDYWVVNLAANLVEVYREPAVDSLGAFGWSYARREIFGSAAQLSPLAAPNGRVRVADLLP